MIVKERDPTCAISQRAEAGARAEMDMAFYLRRAFGNHRAEVLVFHDIRLQHEGETAQIDHLVIHQHGMFVIESKSVSGEIHILADGQFVRTYGPGKQAGMPSPVQQAARQADLLRRLLQAYRNEIRDRKAFGLLQGGFGACPIEIRVAISDNGIIRGNRHTDTVRKADQIADDIEVRMASHRRGSSLLNLDMKNDDGLYKFTPGEMSRLQKFLLDQHVPRSAIALVSESAKSIQSDRAQLNSLGRPHVEAVQAAPAIRGVSGDAPPTRHQCGKCRSFCIHIQYGKYGYYFKCRDCDGNTAIDTRFDDTGKKGSLRKSGRMFYLTCPDTGVERLFFTNPSEQ